MPIKKNDFIEITYTGKLAETGEVFDTTDEKLAKDSGLTHHAHFGPQIICVGEGHVLPGLDEKFEGSELGTYTWQIPTEKGFGKKNPQYIQLIPISTFKKQNIRPMVGLQLNVDGQLGTVKVASGGRVLVDFNHPLAGKDLVYTVTINKIVTDPAVKLKAVLDLNLHLHQEVPITVKDGQGTIELPSAVPAEIQQKLGEHFAKLCGLTKVNFTVATKEKAPTKAPSKDLNNKGASGAK